MGFRINQDLPQELVDLFRSEYGEYWEIVSFKDNVCDQSERIPHIHDNELTIIYHPRHRNSYTVYYFFKINEKDIELKIHGTRWNGWDVDYDEPPYRYHKKKIDKVMEYLKCLVG